MKPTWFMMLVAARADDGDAVAGLVIESRELRGCLGEIYSVLNETLRAERACGDVGQHGRVVVGCHPVAAHDFKLRGDDGCLLYTSPSPRDRTRSRMPSSA